MSQNLRALVVGALLAISTPSVAQDSPIVDRSDILELADLALRCGQKRRVEARDGSYPYNPYLVDEYTLQLNDGSGLRFTFRDGGYNPLSRKSFSPNGIVDAEDSVNYSLWDLSGYCQIVDCHNQEFPFPYRNERAAESVELLKKSVPPYCLYPNIC